MLGKTLAVPEPGARAGERGRAAGVSVRGAHVRRF